MNRYAYLRGVPRQRHLARRATRLAVAVLYFVKWFLSSFKYSLACLALLEDTL
jgi:hypothetical protein